MMDMTFSQEWLRQVAKEEEGVYLKPEMGVVVSFQKKSEPEKRK